jgi:tRNA (guanosine-2'-O-)-methyltransferase
MRSCDAFGVSQVHVLTQAEPFAASRIVAKGSQRWLDVIEHKDPQKLAQHLKDQGYQLFVTHPEGEADLNAIKKIEKVAFIMGNERDGVSSQLANEANGRVRIDMCGFVESLNVSVSAAILLQAATQEREGDLNQGEKDQLYARWLINSVPRAEEIILASASSPDE